MLNTPVFDVLLFAKHRNFFFETCDAMKMEPKKAVINTQWKAKEIFICNRFEEVYCRVKSAVIPISKLDCKTVLPGGDILIK
jgi:hypothetical protein